MRQPDPCKTPKRFHVRGITQHSRLGFDLGRVQLWVKVQMEAKDIAGLQVGAGNGAERHIATVFATRPIDDMRLPVNGQVQLGQAQAVQHLHLALASKSPALAVNECELAIERLGVKTSDLGNALDGRLVHQQRKHVPVLVGLALPVQGCPVLRKRLLARVAAPARGADLGLAEASVAADRGHGNAVVRASLIQARRSWLASHRSAQASSLLDNAKIAANGIQ